MPTDPVGRCCVCKRLRDAAGDWLEPEDLDVPADAAFTDTFCKPCFRTQYPDYAHIAEPTHRFRLVRVKA